MSKIFNIKHVNELEDVAKFILNNFKSERKMLFYGQMGVGKTTLIKKIASFLAVEDLVTSPTFSIINEYKTTTQDIIYHFDFYRVKDENEVYNLGYEHYFSSKAYCFIEWPEKIPNLTDNNMIKIYMELDGNNRIINVKK